jgi:phosphate transport system permease protein
VLEWVIRLCGISAILFVFGIFFFVLRRGRRFLFGELNLFEFFFFDRSGTDARRSNVRYGAVLAHRGHVQRHRARPC